jgi:hypothetical protein
MPYQKAVIVLVLSKAIVLSLALQGLFRGIWDLIKHLQTGRGFYQSLTSMHSL